MKYDLWADDDGELHLLPQGSYRVFATKYNKPQVTLFLNEPCAPDEIAMINVTKGRLLYSDLDLPQGMRYVLDYI